MFNDTSFTPPVALITVTRAYVLHLCIANVLGRKQKHNQRLEPTSKPLAGRPLSNDFGTPNSGDIEYPQTTTKQSPIENKIEDFTKLSLNSSSRPKQAGNPGLAGAAAVVPVSNSLKRSAGAEPDRLDQPSMGDGHEFIRSRRTKGLSGGSYARKDPDFSREQPLQHQSLFDENDSGSKWESNSNKVDKLNISIGSRRVFNTRSRVFRSTKQPVNADDSHVKHSDHSQPPLPIETSSSTAQKLNQLNNYQSISDQQDSDQCQDTEPELLLQPEIRPISHDQLVGEVKGIYTGLVMVEAKCIDVDEKQLLAAQGKDSKQTNLAADQWQALITIHKTLLHEHHDFFLASQHPSASPALKRLAAKYSMPARMWRHGIHAFLEILRYRLPGSRDHMLTFIYIAYSMVALLYETVQSFEDTWIECLGDLGRYRMAIEDDNIRDREVWSGVARFWYGKAADKSPNIGRLYHHLALLARPCTLQQLSLYTQSLTCVLPFESTRRSIMTLFNPILNDKDFRYSKSSVMEIIFIRAHGLLFSRRCYKEYAQSVQQLLNGMDKYISRIAAKFREQGVFAALSNISALFEYGISKVKGASTSILRLALEQLQNSQQKSEQHSTQTSQHTQQSYNNNAADLNVSKKSSSTSIEGLTKAEFDSSNKAIAYATQIAFGVLLVALKRVGDSNVYPLIHVYLAFLVNIANVKEAMKYIEQNVPWVQIALFLTTLAKREVMSSRVFDQGFPSSDEDIGRPLPEDYQTRGQGWVSRNYFPTTWFSDAAIDNEGRTLEFPSTAALRVERILWLGHRIASYQWLIFDKTTTTFSTTQYVEELPQMSIQLLPSSLSEADNAVSNLIDDDLSQSSSGNSSPRRDHSMESPRSELRLSPAEFGNKRGMKSPFIVSSPKVPIKILTKADVEMEAEFVKQEYTNPYANLVTSGSGD